MRLKLTWAVVLLGIPLAFMAAFFVTPFVTVVATSFTGQEAQLTLENYSRLLGEVYYWEVLLLTFEISLWVVVITFVVGYPLAYVMTFVIKSRVLRRLFYIVVVVPLFTSNIVRAFGWMVLLGRKGLMNEMLLQLGIIETPLRVLYTKWAIVIGLGYIMTPFMVLTIAAVLQNIRRSYHDAARDLGAGPMTTFLKVTFPLSLPGVIAGSLIVFTLSVSAYVTPAILSGGNETVMSMLIFQQYASVFNFPFGAALAVGLLVTTMILIIFYLLAVERQRARAA